MSKLSNNYGRGYEYIWLETLAAEIKSQCSVNIKENSSYNAAKKAWNSLSLDNQDMLKISAIAAIGSLFKLEPMILENTNSPLELFIQPDLKGESGDVRDIIIAREDVKWEIGLSLKHRHFAVKHSRLAKHLDFVNRWFGVPCSQKYWDDITPIFSYLEKMCKDKKLWRDLPNKEDIVYVPLLKAFMAELNRVSTKKSDVPAKLVEYLLGKFDFYKIISIDEIKTTQIQSYNLHGNLNKASKITRPTILVPVSALPTRIVDLDFKRFGQKKSKTSIELYMDKGWQFSFRIHNASTAVETSLKFDIKAIGLPVTILTLNCRWN